MPTTKLTKEEVFVKLEVEEDEPVKRNIPKPDDRQSIISE